VKVGEHIRLAARLPFLAGLATSEETLIGGQAVVEGVMMRAPHSYCVAVRKPDGSIVTDSSPVVKPSERNRLWGLPVFRGMATLGQAMYLGIRALRFSASAALEEGPGQTKSREIPGWVMAANLAFSFGFFVLLYKFVPLWLTTRLEASLPALEGRVAFNLTDGLLRIAIFVAFLVLISRWRDIRRVFEYHGAEHKVVFNFESGLPVTVENAQRFSPYHPRCGTSFLLVVMLVAIAVYAILPFESFLMKFASRVLLLPLIAGLSYEAIRYSARRRESLLAVLTAPGLWLQRITALPPSNEQTEVAICALEGAMALEAAQGGRLALA